MKACGPTTTSPPQRSGRSSAWISRPPGWTGVRAATIRLSNCTASFVSPDGLILTNHHCAAACLEQLSSAERDLLRNGYVSATREAELRCPTQYADVLMKMEDVTAKVSAATQGMSDKDATRRARRRSRFWNRNARRRQVRVIHDAANQCGCTRAASTSSTSTGVTPKCGWSSRRKPPSPPSAEIRTISSFRAGAWTCRCCVPTRMASPRQRRIISR